MYCLLARLYVTTRELQSRSDTLAARNHSLSSARSHHCATAMMTKVAVANTAPAVKAVLMVPLLIVRKTNREPVMDELEYRKIDAASSIEMKMAIKTHADASGVRSMGIVIRMKACSLELPSVCAASSNSRLT